jgi:hypothetical protein
VMSNAFFTVISNRIRVFSHPISASQSSKPSKNEKTDRAYF